MGGPPPRSGAGPRRRRGVPLRWWFLVYAVGEAVLAAAVARALGWGAVLALLLAAAVAGAALVRAGGAGALAALRRSAQAGSLPDGRAGDGVLVAAGGLLLMAPGFATDVLGLLLLLPPTRALVRRRAGRALAGRMRAGGVSVVTTTGPDGSPVARVVPGRVVPGTVVHDGPAPDEGSARQPGPDAPAPGPGAPGRPGPGGAGPPALPGGPAPR